MSSGLDRYCILCNITFAVLSLYIRLKKSLKLVICVALISGQAVYGNCCTSFPTGIINIVVVSVNVNNITCFGIKCCISISVFINCIQACKCIFGNTEIVYLCRICIVNNKVIIYINILTLLVLLNSIVGCLCRILCLSVGVISCQCLTCPVLINRKVEVAGSLLIAVKLLLCRISSCAKVYVISKDKCNKCA